MRTHQNDALDLLCRVQYGDESGFFEAMLAANRGLADQGPTPPMNREILFPDLDLPDPSIPVVTLYD